MLNTTSGPGRTAVQTCSNTQNMEMWLGIARIWCCWIPLVSSHRLSIWEPIRGGLRADDMLRESRIVLRLDIGGEPEEAKGTTGLVPTPPLQRNN
jgi:hypothetical protein